LRQSLARDKRKATPQIAVGVLRACHR
jgi:hypothetical protein